jgi:hypothetical protein
MADFGIVHGAKIGYFLLHLRGGKIWADSLASRGSADSGKYLLWKILIPISVRIKYFPSTHKEPAQDTE